MIRNTNLLFLASLLIWLSSCTTTQEELWIEPDGSGRFVSTMDMSAMYPFLMMGMSEEEGEAEETDLPEDPIDKIMEGLLKQEEVDTTFSMADMVASDMPMGFDLEMMLDSIKQTPAAEQGITEEEKQMSIKAMESMLGLKMRLQASRPKQMLKLSSIQRFDEIGDFTNFGDAINDLGKVMGESPSDEMFSQMMGGGTTSFRLDGKKLRIQRQGMSLDSSEMEDNEEAAQAMAMMQMFMGDTPYQLTVHFPGKVKKFESEYAERTDKRTLVIEIPQEKLSDPDFEFDLGVRFKGLK